MHAAEGFPSLLFPDDTAVEREKILQGEKLSTRSTDYLEMIQKQLDSLQEAGLLKLHEIDVSDLKDDDIWALQTQIRDYLNKLGKFEKVTVVVASYRLLGFVNLRKVLRVEVTSVIQPETISKKKRKVVSTESKKKVILVDLDGTVADIDKGLALKFPDHEHLIVDRKDSDFAVGEHEQMFRAEMTKPGFFLGLSLIEEGAKFVREMLQSDMCERLVFVSSPLKNAPHCIPEKIQWIEKHFGFDLARSAVFCKDKTLVRGDVLVDDRPQTGSMKPTWKQYFPPTSYNTVETPRLPSRDWLSVFLQ